MDIDIRDDREEPQDGSAARAGVDDRRGPANRLGQRGRRGARRDERAVLAELRVLAALTRVYRDPDAVGLEAPPDRGRGRSSNTATACRRWGSLDGVRTGRQGRIRQGLSRARSARAATSRSSSSRSPPKTPLRSRAACSARARSSPRSATATSSSSTASSARAVSSACGWSSSSGRTMEDELRARGPLERRGSDTHRRGPLPGARRRARPRPRPPRRQGAERDARGGRPHGPHGFRRRHRARDRLRKGRTTRPARRCISPQSSSTGNRPRARRTSTVSASCSTDGDARVPGRGRQSVAESNARIARAESNGCGTCGRTSRASSSRPSSARSRPILRRGRRRPVSSKRPSPGARPTPVVRYGPGGSAPRLSPPQSCSSPCRLRGSSATRPTDSDGTNPSPAAAVERDAGHAGRAPSILPTPSRRRMFRTRNGVETPLTPNHRARRRRPGVDAHRSVERRLCLRDQCR